MDIRLSPITPAGCRDVVDLFNHYGLNSLAAFPEEPLPSPFFDRLMEAARGWPGRMGGTVG